MWYIIFTLTQQICRLSLLDFTDHLGMTLGLLRQFSMVVASFRAQSMEDWTDLFFVWTHRYFPRLAPGARTLGLTRAATHFDSNVFLRSFLIWGYKFEIIVYIVELKFKCSYLLKSRKNSPVTEQVSNSIRFLDTLIFISLGRFSISVTEETLRCSIGYFLSYLNYFFAVFIIVNVLKFKKCNNLI